MNMEMSFTKRIAKMSDDRSMITIPADLNSHFKPGDLVKVIKLEETDQGQPKQEGESEKTNT